MDENIPSTVLLGLKREIEIYLDSKNKVKPIVTVEKIQQHFKVNLV